jgi:hypothetical protein
MCSTCGRSREVLLQDLGVVGCIADDQADPNSREHLMPLGVRATLMHLRWDPGLLKGEFGMEGVVVALEASPKSRNRMLLFSPHVTTGPDFW